MTASYTDRLLELLMAILLGVSTVLGSLTSTVGQPDGTVDPLRSVQATSFDCAELTLFDTPLVTPSMGNVECGTALVPENWSDPEGRQISLTYVILKSTSPTPKPDPIVYLEGGPGGSAISALDAYAGRIFDEMRAERDIIIYDQRGTQFSSPLRCSFLTVDELFSSGPEATDDYEPVDLTQPLDEAAIMQTARESVGADARRCANELTAQGIDLRQYNSVASSNDLVALMHALGYPTYNLFGISYGTRLALVMMRDHPDAGVRSVVIDSVFPPEIPGFERFVTEAHEVVMQLFSDCRLDPVCDSTYPNLKERFKTLLASAKVTPIVGNDGATVTAFDLVNVVTAISSYTESAAYIPKMIDELERGVTTTYSLIVSGGIPSGAVDAGDAVEDASGGEMDAAPAPGAPAASVPDEPAAQAEAFIQLVRERASQLAPSDSETVLLLLTWLDKVPRTRESLESFVRQAFPAAELKPVRDELLAQIDLLSDEAVAAIFDEMEGSVDIIDIFTFGLNQPMFDSVECNEEAPFEDFSEVIRNAQALEIPELAYGTISFMAEQFATCELWPSGRAKEIESRPVVSDIPTLIMAGNYDFQTPLSWNRSAFVNLTNSYYVQFPSSGHGVIAQSQCAKDIAKAFIDTPYRQPDSSCTADLWPIWAMPDGA